MIGNNRSTDARFYVELMLLLFFFNFIVMLFLFFKENVVSLSVDFVMGVVFRWC